MYIAQITILKVGNNSLSFFDKKSGRYLNAPFFTGLTLRQAVEKAEREFDSPYDK